jgi:cobalt-zinc-cadmium efflux system membrane fusion protein
MRWNLHTVNAPDTEATIDEIGYMIDPGQHTAIIKGHIDNPQGKLRAGQFVSATIDLPPPADAVEIPLTALVEDGRQSFVFVKTDPEKPRYTLRRVVVTHRFEKTAFVRSMLSPEQQRLSPEESAQGQQTRQPLRPGERYLVTGALELRAALIDLVSKSRAP